MLLINSSSTEGEIVNYVSFTPNTPVTFFSSQDKSAVVFQFTDVQQLY